MLTVDWGILAGSVGPRIRGLRNYLNARSIAVSEPFGLPTGSLTVMALIEANPGSSQTELAEAAAITGPGLVGIADELERRGLVSRARSTIDRRRNTLILTAAGEAKLEQMFAVVREIEDPIRNALGEADLAVLTSLLDRAAAACREAEDLD